MTAPSASRPSAFEAPTVALAVVIYGGWLALTYWWEHVPFVLLCALGGWLVAWQGSLQHEVMHGHPTRNRRINDAVGRPPLSLWLPYPVYRLSHLRHHRDEHLTDPIEDPESVYVTSEGWRRLGGLGRAVAGWNMTLLGRLTIGPLLMIGGFLLAEARLILAGEGCRRAIWARHALDVALVLGWVVGVAGMPVATYLFAFVFVGAALTRLRSFAEHRYAEQPEERTAIVENGGLLGLLYLNNNLHVLHHMAPAEPWYRLPRLYAARRTELTARNGGLVYRSYGDVIRRFLLRRHDDALHPRA